MGAKPTHLAQQRVGRCAASYFVVHTGWLCHYECVRYSDRSIHG